MKKVKIGLMLGGGGAKGAYQLGVIRALEEANLLTSVKTLSGTSIGAINTMLLMSKSNHSKMTEIWSEIDNHNIFATKGNIFDKESNRMYSIEPLAETLIKKINLKAIKKSKYKGFATAALMHDKLSLMHQINTDTMEKTVFELKKMKNPYQGVLASASIPVVFGPTVIDDKYYVDGGVLDNYPVQPLIDDGCNLIFSVPLDQRFKPQLFDDRVITIVDFTSDVAFSKNLLVDLLEIIKFDSRFKEEKEEIGYIVGKLMVKKIRQLGILKKTKYFKKWRIKEGFNLIQLDETDEEFIKDYKLKIQRKYKEKIKREKQLAKEE